MKYLEMLAFSYITSSHSYEQLKFIQTTRSPKNMPVTHCSRKAHLIISPKKDFTEKRGFQNRHVHSQPMTGCKQPCIQA